MFKISAKIHEQVPYKSEVNGAVDISCHMVLQKWPIFVFFHSTARCFRARQWSCTHSEGTAKQIVQIPQGK